MASKTPFFTFNNLTGTGDFLAPTDDAYQTCKGLRDALEESKPGRLKKRPLKFAFSAENDGATSDYSRSEIRATQLASLPLELETIGGVALHQMSERVLKAFEASGFEDYRATPFTVLHKPTKREWPGYWVVAFPTSLSLKEVTGTEPCFWSRDTLMLLLSLKLKQALEAFELPAIEFHKTMLKTR